MCPFFSCNAIEWGLNIQDLHKIGLTWLTKAKRINVNFLFICLFITQSYNVASKDLKIAETIMFAFRFEA